MDIKKLALFGGTFDPPHQAHLTIANAVIDKKIADKVMFIPAAIPPHKNSKNLTSFEHRFQMLKTLVKDNNNFLISDIEQKRIPSPSYTITTVKSIKKQFPNTIIYLLIGGDSLMQLHTWHKAKSLVKHCKLIIYPRPNYNISQIELEKNWNPIIVKEFLENVIEVPEFDLSSTEIRKKITNNQKFDTLLDKGVVKYINKNKLYQERKVDERQ